MNKCLFLLSAIVGVAAYSSAQSWTYSGNSMCYNYGSGSVQCYSAGTIQRYATSQDQFKNGYAAGQGIGNLAAAILGRWSEHHKIVEQERDDLRTQLRSYGQANDKLLGELVTQSNALIELWPKLALYDTKAAQDSEKNISDFRKWASNFSKQKANYPKNIEIIAGAKSTKFLRQSLDVETRNHQTLYEMASGNYVFVELVKATIGYYERAAVPASSTNN
jgi:hypothetical protein